MDALLRSWITPCCCCVVCLALWLLAWGRRRQLYQEAAKLRQKAESMLRSGASEESLALSVAWGVAGGIFPVPGITMPVTVGVAWLLRRCHVPAAALVNVVVTPLDFAMVIPFIRLGERLTGTPPVELDMSSLASYAGMWRASTSLALGVVGWAAAAPCVVAALFFPSRFAIGRAMRRTGAKIRES